ncbi:DNA topoisomerase 1 [subsurface metagenome]|nr:type I DNA topoisomerase [Bacteroidota bacterium]
MIENLVIVESPAKARTIERFLGKDFHVKSSFGHIRDLAKKNLGIELDNKYKPQYIISEDKKKIVAELKKIAGEAKIVWLASDEDREGEAIAWHLSEVLNLKPENTKRIVFHEITKSAIQAAIQQPRGIDRNLVNSQQARRVLDRLVGFELSPILWKKVQPSLSAGRVQSVAVRLLVEREREILSFKPAASYKIEGIFMFLDQDGQERSFKAEIPKRFPSKQKTLEFLNKNKDAEYVVTNIEVKPTKRWPPPPFTTSTLQQEASWKLGFSVTQTMLVAQKLYEAGKITYMRTDSVNLSNLALSTAKKAISNEFGNEYIKIRKYKTKAKGAQEAHEAIRPTYLQNKSIDGAATEKKLYEIIWKRTIASQMSDALLEKTVATIDVSTTEEDFIATGEVIKFDGFLKVYTESKNEEAEGKKKNILPPLKINQTLTNKSILGIEKFTQPQSRYTEAGLVKNLEELGIGRPSTYAPTISTIQNRGYVVKEDRPGSERKINLIRLENKVITKEIQTEFAGREKGKLFPNDIGMIVNDFLVDHFKDIINYNFTAKVEKEFDEIALGKLDWTEMIDEFYQSFHKKVEETLKRSEKKTGERILGEDPVTRLTVLVKMGRYGPVAQLGDAGKDKKPRFARLLKGQLIETITLEEALNLFKLPRTIGAYEEKEVIIGVGKFGPYIRHNDKFYSLKKGIDDPLTIEIERAKELIEEKRKSDRKKVIKTFSEDPDILILKGRYGPYLSYKKKNYRIPKAKNPGALSYEESLELIKKGQKSSTKNK